MFQGPFDLRTIKYFENRDSAKHAEFCFTAHAAKK